jgi:hypothetical protein
LNIVVTARLLMPSGSLRISVVSSDVGFSRNCRQRRGKCACAGKAQRQHRANHAEAVAILAKFTKQPPERLDSWLFTKKDDYRDPNGLPDLDVLQKNIRSQKDLGFIKSDLDVPKYADLTLVKEAVQRIK